MKIHLISNFLFKIKHFISTYEGHTVSVPWFKLNNLLNFIFNAPLVRRRGIHGALLIFAGTRTRSMNRWTIDCTTELPNIFHPMSQEQYLALLTILKGHGKTVTPTLMDMHNKLTTLAI